MDPRTEYAVEVGRRVRDRQAFERAKRYSEGLHHVQHPEDVPLVSTSQPQRLSDQVRGDTGAGLRSRNPDGLRIRLQLLHQRDSSESPPEAIGASSPWRWKT